MGVRSVLFGGARITPLAADLGITAVRVGFGLAMAFAHGTTKVPVKDEFVAAVAEMGMPMPVLFAWAAALSELAGGCLLAVGALTRVASFFLLCTMGVAFFVVHGSDPFDVKERALLYGLVALAFMLAGSGRFSVDALLRRPAAD